MDPKAMGRMLWNYIKKNIKKIFEPKRKESLWKLLLKIYLYKNPVW